MTDPAQAWRELMLTIARVYRLDVPLLWLARQRWVIWLDAHLPELPWPWWRVWVWCAYVYTALVLSLFAWSFLTGRLP